MTRIDAGFAGAGGGSSPGGEIDAAQSDTGGAPGTGGSGTGGQLGYGGANGSGGAGIVDSGGAGIGGSDAAGSGGADAAGIEGPDAAADSIGFSCLLNCNGSTEVFMGVRPPQTAGSNVISWTAGAGVPTGDQLWTYDSLNRVLVNRVNNLALKTRPDTFIELGTTATDGTPLTLRLNVDNS